MQVYPQSQMHVWFKNILFFRKYSIQPAHPVVTPTPDPTPSPAAQDFFLAWLESPSQFPWRSAFTPAHREVGQARQGPPDDILGTEVRGKDRNGEGRHKKASPVAPPRLVEGAGVVPTGPQPLCESQAAFPGGRAEVGSRGGWAGSCPVLTHQLKPQRRPSCRRRSRQGRG